MNDKTKMYTNLGEGIAVSLVILSICFGIGGCNYLSFEKPVNQTPKQFLSTNVVQQVTEYKKS